MTEDKDWFVIVTEVQNMRWLTSVATSILWTTAPESEQRRYNCQVWIMGRYGLVITGGHDTTSDIIDIKQGVPKKDDPWTLF